MLTINVVTLFPEVFAPAFAASILGRAAAQGLVRYRTTQLRDYTHDKHQVVETRSTAAAPMVLCRSRFSKRWRI
jgi:tRNA (guanine-N1)-methyltransferase